VLVLQSAALDQESQAVAVAYSHLRKHIITIDERRVMGKLLRFVFDIIVKFNAKISVVVISESNIFETYLKRSCIH